MGKKVTDQAFVIFIGLACAMPFVLFWLWLKLIATL
ncbi:hypothetical protein FHS18_001818 [Paenibacillus phyllosphaerae]|uniref:Uncharacterized protein n=1 Tax=Paenibacillus phyllosphaerae TaxID=274593 RepID=A0A7W5AVU7_9BACL|nr:hypothetical protein [Paenibacillus phyllosphaerae]